MTDTLSTALERVSETPKAKTVLDLLARSRPEIEKGLPAGVDWQHFDRCVRTEIRRTPKLLDCDPYSLLGAVMYAAQLGLEPGPLGHVYLIPFKREVQFIIGYKGFVDLSYRSGGLKAIATGTVREGDAFQWREGTRPYLDHTPSGPPDDRTPTHYYACAHLTTGGHPFRVLFPEDVERARAKSAAKDSPFSPWTTHYDEMARKTAVRRLAPLLPLTPLMARALAADETTPVLGQTDLIGEEA